MDFKYINDRNKTPISKSKNGFSKTPNSKSKNVFSSTVNCDSPFRCSPNFSTPPSRFSKIINPFERQLIDSLHLPTFSPSVFSKVSTPKTNDNFNWSIDQISSLKPADIDEETISQHVFEDPSVESIVQQKIDKFFSDKIIVPSPLTEVVRIPLIIETPNSAAKFEPIHLPVKREYSEGSAQTVLSFPPTNLPEQIEELFKPYLTYLQDQQKPDDEIQNTSLYHHLFEYEDEEKSHYHEDSIQSSPALSTGLSPIQFSPVHVPAELRECSLSPISRQISAESRSACRLNFSDNAGMSIDASMVVPDVAYQMSSQSVYIEEHSPQPAEPLSDSTVHWEMEYRHVSLASPCSSPDSEKMDVSNSNTPHSRIFTSQRKRLSDSFKDEDDDFNKENEVPVENIRQIRKIFKNDVTDAGYHTENTFYEDSLFASTPSKRSHH